jgi:choline dehydrogenase-like flavoprotein
VIVERGRAAGVRGALLHPETHAPCGRFEVRARLGVVAAAGALHTPLLLRRTGLRRNVGDRFQAHPGLAVLGRFPFAVGMGFGATQGYEVPLRERGFKLESISVPPELLASRIPGAGAEWEERIGSLDRFAQWAGLVRAGAMGKVRPGFGGNPSVSYELEARDLARARDATVLLCRMMFAAGAVEVFPGVAGLPDVITSPAEIEAIAAHPLRAADLHVTASHLFGTACAGADPRTTVVGPDLQSHELPGLHVMDASVFPTNLGVNPQHSIMALAWRGAERLAEEDRSRRTLH